MVPTSLIFMFASIIFLLSLFQVESPRYLIKKRRLQEATTNIARIRNLPEDHEYVVQEINAIDGQWQEEQEATKGQGPLGIVKEILTIPRNLYRFYLGMMAQILSQWSSAGSITIYAVDLFALFGVRGNNEGLLITAVFGIVKLVAALFDLPWYKIGLYGQKHVKQLPMTQMRNADPTWCMLRNPQKRESPMCEEKKTTYAIGCRAVWFLIDSAEDDSKSGGGDLLDVFVG